MILKIMGTALTGIGGHYLNKRWDKAVLFQSLFILYCLFCLILLRMYFFSHLSKTNASPDQMMQQFRDVTSKVSLIYLAGVVLLWAISIALTIADGKKTEHTDTFKWTGVGIVAASLTTLLSFLLIGYTSMLSVSTLRTENVKIGSASVEAPHNQPSHDFFEYIYFGGTPSDSRKLPDPPEGSGILKGRIMYKNKPAEAVKLDIILNSKYRTRNMITDSNGYFNLKLPVGDWKINSIQTESWQYKPSGDHFSIYYGGEAKLVGNKFNPYNRFQSDGLRIAIGENGHKTHLSLVIKDDIELIWPDDNSTGIYATLSDTISWKPYPSAAKYYIAIKHLRREGTTTYYDPITSKVLSGETEIPLSSLKHVKTKEKGNQEYAAEIYAFSDDGTLIGEHSDTYRGGTFVLNDGNVLLEDQLQSLFDFTSGEDPDQLQKKMEGISLDRRRIDAVEILINENMISPAEALLKLINSEYVKGKKEVLSGYILALKGNCSESDAMFSKALAINPDVCIPEEYKNICD